MATKTEITCFTDLKGSTALTEQMGHRSFMPLLKEHLRLGKVLAERNNGKYVKNIGDAHMVRFEYIDHALAFASQLQQLCSARPGVAELAIQVRISLFQGAVEPLGDDVFGSGVNQAARLQGPTEPSHVTMNQDLFETMKKAYGKEDSEQYCSSLGMHELKGIDGKHQLYSFDWIKFSQARPEESLANLLHAHLQQANIELSNIKQADLNRPGQVIWPVVPRDLATAIHRGQIELIRLLAQLGWEVVVLIADCGGEAEYDDVYVERFQACIESHLSIRKVRLAKVYRMSKLYEPAYAHYTHIQALFRRITSQMTVQVLMDINTKGYSQEVKDEIKGKTTLTYLRPPLTVAAVLHLAESALTKCAVIAGSDENLQWNQAYTIPNAREEIGVLMIPVVKMDKQYQIHQRGQWPIWHSEVEVARQSSGSNLAWWLFRLLAFLPAFPDSGVEIAGKEIDPAGWTDQLSMPTDVDLGKLISHIWPVLNPA